MTAVVHESKALPEVATLEDLARTIEAEHQATARAGRAMVEHAIKCGQALLAAKEQVPQGHWERWLLDTFPDRTTKTWRLYMRIAKHREQVRASGASNLNEAHRLLAGEPARRGDAQMKARAIELRGKGMSYQAIATEVGASHHAVSTWCDPKLAEKRRARQNQQSKKARRAAGARARAKFMTATGGPLDDAFRKVRVAQQSLEEASTEQDRTKEQLAAIRLAVTKLQHAEDQIVLAARVDEDQES